MNVKTYALRYLLTFVYFLSFLHASKEEKKGKKTVKVRVMINKCVKKKKAGNEGQELELEIPENTIIELPGTAKHGHLTTAILDKSCGFYFRKNGSRRVDIFKNPPSHANMLKIHYYHSEEHHKSGRAGSQKSLTKTKDIKDGDQFYAIVHNKNDVKSNTITVFLDYQHSKEAVLFLVPKFYCNTYTYQLKLFEGNTKKAKEANRFPYFHKKLLEVAKKTFAKRLEDKKKANNSEEEAIDNLTKRVELFYPADLQKLADKEQVHPLSLLKNGDRMSLRNDKPKLITLTIKMLYKKKGIFFVDEKKSRRIEKIFYNNDYVDDIVKYVTKKLHWGIDYDLMFQEIKDGEISYHPLAAEERLENLPFFHENSMVLYARGRIVQKSKRKSYPLIYLVINKRATSNTTEEQNPQIIDLRRFSLETGMEELVNTIEMSLKREFKNNNITHDYSKMKKRLTIYRARPNGDLKQVPIEKQKGETDENRKTLEELGIEPYDTIFAIVASHKNRNQISFFVKDETNGAVVLITEKIRKNGPAVEERILKQIRQKAIDALMSLEKREPGLPLLDIDIVEKTELVFNEGEEIRHLKNATETTIKLKTGYQTITIEVNTNNEPFILRIAVPVESKFQDIIREADRQTKWDDEAEKVLLYKSASGVLTELNLEDTLAKSSITVFYLKYKSKKVGLQNSDNNLLQLQENQLLNTQPVADKGESPVALKPAIGELAKKEKEEKNDINHLFVGDQAALSGKKGHSSVVDDGAQDIHNSTYHLLENSDHDDSGKSDDIKDDGDNNNDNADDGGNDGDGHIDDNDNNDDGNDHDDNNDDDNNDDSNDHDDNNDDDNDDDDSNDGDDKGVGGNHFDASDAADRNHHSSHDGDSKAESAEPLINMETAITTDIKEEKINQGGQSDGSFVNLANHDPRVEPAPYKEDSNRRRGNRSMVEKISLAGALGVAGALVITTWGSEAHAWLKGKMSSKSEENDL